MFKHSRLRIALFVMLMCSFTLPATAQQVSPLPRFEPGECAFAIPAGAAVDCGSLIVPENRLTPATTDEIQLAVAIFRTQAENPAADPVVFLQGGPGGGIVAQMPFFYSSFIAPITATRDFVVFDQRGTGLSQPSLDCPQVTELITATLREDYAVAEATPLYLEALTACRETLTAAGIDLSAYTSAASAADIADLAAALDYAQVNLYGGSYGTRLALTTMRDFPTLVRSAVLDGVLPPPANQIEIIAAKSDYALSAFFAGCALDANCAVAYPDLEASFYQTVERLTTTPAPITVTIPTTGETITTTVDGVDFISSIFIGLQQSELIPSIPATIQAVSEGDLTPLQNFLTLPILVADGINIGMFISVMCAEEIPATTPEALDAAAAAYPALEAFAQSAYYGSGQTITDVCATWGAAAYNPRESEAVVSTLPTLILSGEYDPATPPYFGAQAAETLTNSYQYVIPGAGHVASPGGGCPLNVALAFLNDPTTEPDSTCLAALQPQFQTPLTEITLVPLENATFGFSSVLPDGWSELAPDSGTYGENVTATVVLLQQAAPLPADQLLTIIANQAGLASAPEVTGTVTSALFTWSLYELTIQGQPADLALAEQGGTTYLVMLISTPAQRDLYYNGAFLPALNALAPLE